MHIFFKKIIFILEIWRIICIQLMYIKIILLLTSILS